MKVIGVIPSRLSSSRLSKKPLAEISGIPMIAHVIERSKLCKGLDDLYIATDSIEICEVAKQHNCKYFLTSKDHATGTDRIGEIISLIDADIIVNIQGDEALVRPSDIEASFKLLIDRPNLDMGMLATNFNKSSSPSDIKVILNQLNEIICFSRGDIPYQQNSNSKNFLKAFHVVSFRKKALKNFCSLEQTPIEKIESIEYMRAVENNIKIGCKVVESNAISVDTPTDLEIVKKLMKEDQLSKKYLK